MAKADVIYKDHYRCKQCKNIFSLTKYWRNCFFCSQDCSVKFNACYYCGRNKHFDCRCEKE